VVGLVFLKYFLERRVPVKTWTPSIDRDSYRRFKICFSMGYYGDKTNIDAGRGFICEHSVTVFIAMRGDRARGTNQETEMLNLEQFCKTQV
jgi:hypothetical protein